MADVYYPVPDGRAEEAWADTFVSKGPEVPAQTKPFAVIRNSIGFPSKQIFVLSAQKNTIFEKLILRHMCENLDSFLRKKLKKKKIEKIEKNNF